MDILHLHRESLVATGQYNKRLTGEGMCPLGPGQLRHQHEDQGGCWCSRPGHGLAVQAALVPLLALLLAPAAPAPLLDGGAAGLAGLGAAGLLAASPLLSPLAVGGAAGVGFSLPTGV